MLGELKRMFVGRTVSITHSGDHSVSIKDQTGVCWDVHETPGKIKNHFDIELENQHRIGIIVEETTETSVEGSMGQIRGKRKIEAIS